MKLCAIVVAACGGAKPAPAPIANTAPASQTAPAPGEARVIARTASGGEIELTGDHATALDAAKGEMARHCGVNAWEIVQDAEKPVRDRDGNPTTAWRVLYACRQ